MEKPLGAWLLILWLQLGWASGQNKVEQTPVSLRTREGQNCAMKCKYTIRNFYGLYWYRQHPGKGPEPLFYLSSDGEKENGRFTANLETKDSSSSLIIRNSQLEDSATYFCAGETHGGGSYNLLFGKGTKVTIVPNVTNPQPRMYHLKKPRVNDLSVCLFTDFGNEEVNMMGINNIKRTPSMVAEKRLASKSLGIVAWNNNLDWKCQAKISNITYSLSNSSDPYLNSINLAMIFLRVIFVKTVGFNLLMTLKLWSS
uniref:Ig-like domain-containing protein n=1 Tax=Ornithorhynchus anatinus TaxID=9258 RepID=A0A6I8N2N3_ORNAN